MLKIEVKYAERIDKYIANNSEVTRNDIQDLISEGCVFVNGVKINKNKFIVKENDVIEITRLIDKTVNIKEQNIELDIVFENDDLLIINKPSGMVVHPAPGHHESTLVNGLIYHFKNNLSDVNNLTRMGIVHRIDKDTSGLLIVAKNNKIHNYLASLLKKHEIKRTYIAICDGKIINKILNIDAPIGRDIKNRQKFAVTDQNSKQAYTIVEVLGYLKIDGKDKTLVKCNLKTGRTHQIRVHLAYIKHPVYGDPIYNKKIDDFNQRLHAQELEFINIDGHKIQVSCPLPKIMDDECKNLNN
ncbi:RluA family pseudouridine synthase [Metamycoplasma subdolum]|uniref:Pseudouridine synthase n=1 Tax=Metamycoplasma subdolum TaxID=92407 RepID=A0A3M0A4P4_9BACT|nr:RluA family pseudouridine synthase [Metamycoplasma subdolum]RMA77435.1 RluA family pseudouridine synthase [Metamycoplasma subdolum]WPB50336.1 RluA family pseudouridine synthase [Metamycoplasma subdolum]